MKDIFQIFLFAIFCNVLLGIIPFSIYLYVYRRKLRKQKCMKQEVAIKHQSDRQKVSTLLINEHNQYKSEKNFIEKIHEVQVGLSEIDRKIVFGSNGTSFDIASYMRFYDLVKLKDASQKIECYYLDDGIGGRPYIMATDKTGSIYKNIKPLYAACKQSHNLSGFSKIDTLLKSHSAKSCVIADDTPMGYVQLLYFCEFGDNFSLFWHAASGDKYVVTSQDQVLNQAKIWESDHYEYSLIHFQKHSFGFMKDSLMNMNDLIELKNRDFERLKAITDSDLEPIIEMDENYCYIEWIENHTHDGMYKCKYQISRSDCSIKQVAKDSIISVTPTFMY